jgi:hypothetical protein
MADFAEKLQKSGSRLIWLKPTPKMKAWIEARKRHHLCHTQVHMAPRTGMNRRSWAG